MVIAARGDNLLYAYLSHIQPQFALIKVIITPKLSNPAPAIMPPAFIALFVFNFLLEPRLT